MTILLHNYYLFKIHKFKGDEQEKSRDRNYKRTRRFQGRIVGNQVMF